MKNAMMIMLALVIGLSFSAATFAGEGAEKKDKPTTEKPKEEKPKAEKK